MRRILFVDDDPNILSALRRMLRPMSGPWRMTFAASGREALDLLACETFDAIVTDMRMPEMNGAHLLREVRERHPGVVRLALSGHSDQELVLEALASTHQFLAKPCETGELKTALERACDIEPALAGQPALIELINGLVALPSTARNCAELAEEVRATGPSPERIGRIVARDVGMTAKIMQLAHSSFFGPPRAIPGPMTAIASLNFDLLRRLVLDSEAFSRSILAAPLKMSLRAILRHSQLAASLARQLALLEGAGADLAELAATASLLHDAGRLMITTLLPEEEETIQALARERGLALSATEREVLGASHEAIGARLVRLWGLPETIAPALAFHHHPAAAGLGAGTERDVLAFVHAADALALEAYAPFDGLLATPLDKEWLAATGFPGRLAAWRESCQAAIRTDKEVCPL